MTGQYLTMFVEKVSCKMRELYKQKRRDGYRIDVPREITKYILEELGHLLDEGDGCPIDRETICEPDCVNCEYYRNWEK